MNDIRRLSIVQLQTLYRSGELSPVEVTKAVISDAQSAARQLNAFAEVTEEQAMADAHLAEAAFCSGEDLGALQGVPIAIKDNLETKGIPTRVGSPVFSAFVPDQDADVVSRLKATKSVSVGKTTMLELAYGYAHPSVGVAPNPWNTEHTASGSSNGSAVAVAAGLVYGAIGTDTGGSIRIPSAYCGLVGMKPTYGLVSCHGVVPLAWSLDHVGPITRSVEDNALFLEAIAPGFSAHDPQIRLGARGLRVGVMSVLDTVDPDVRNPIENVLAGLKRDGANLVDVSTIGDFGQFTAVLMGTLLAEAAATQDGLIDQHLHEYHPRIRDQLLLGSMLPAVGYIRAQRVRKKLIDALEDHLKDLDVLVLPTAPTAAPREDAVVELDDITRFTGPFNVSGLPALSLPCGTAQNGLPVAMQIVGHRFAEAIVYRAARACERITGCGGQLAPGW